MFFMCDLFGENDKFCTNLIRHGSCFYDYFHRLRAHAAISHQIIKGMKMVT
jgi:hypothetical protein